jgi:hypothetical protein
MNRLGDGGLYVSGYGPVAGWCENGNEHQSCSKRWDFLTIKKELFTEQELCFKGLESQPV